MPGAALHLPRVVLVGRPNAGKSTLFNRLLRRRKALVDPTPGVTRDPNQAVATWDGRSVLLIDTGGFEAEGAVGLEHAVRERSLAAVRDADVVLYVLDGKAGLSPADEAAARELRRLGANVLFVVNKLDSPRREATAGEFHRLGAAELVAVSAEHGHGIGALVEAMLGRLTRVPAAPDERPAVAPEERSTVAAEELPAVAPEERRGAIRVSVVGRPNVGKSSLVNRLLGYPRALVDAQAGTTRDAVDTLLEVEGTRYLLVDTAGLRRRARIHERLERSAAGKAIEALARSDVAVVVLDAGEGATEQDMRLATLAWDEGRALVVVANKWDLRTAAAKTFVAELRARFPSLADVPVLTVSALTGAGVETILPAVKRVAAAHDAELKTARLNDVLAAAVRAQEPPVLHGRRPRIYYATQVRHRPPEIAIFTSAPTGIPPSYQRYLQKQIAAGFRLRGTPVRLHFRARH